MNQGKLQEYIAEYKELIFSEEYGELYKWKAIKTFQDNWDIDTRDFGVMYRDSFAGSKNLLTSGNFFPLKMMEGFIGWDKNQVRDLFRELYSGLEPDQDEGSSSDSSLDEYIDLSDRISNFTEGCEFLMKREKDPKVTRHYHRERTISAYLSFRYPEQFYMYKFTMYKDFALALDYETPPIRGNRENTGKFFELADQIADVLSMDEELLAMHLSRLTADCYQDDGLTVLTQDFIWCVNNYIIPNQRRYWAGGAYWDDGKVIKTQDFIRDGNWEIGWGIDDPGGTLSYNRISEIKVGDFFALKSFSVSAIHVFALGTVTNIDNTLIGTIEVDWKTTDNFTLEPLKGEGAGNWNDTLLEITQEDAITSVFQSVAKKAGPIARDATDDIDDDLHEDDKIPFRLDKVVETDKLGREPVARAFANLLKKDIFTEDLDHSFMVHLQGEWGSGKSSFLNFIRKNLNSPDQKWIVIEYNAWENQHIIPPWWTFIDQIYHQAKSALNLRQSVFLVWAENRRRILWYSGWQKIFALMLTGGFILLLLKFGDSIIQLVNDTSINDTPTNDTAVNAAPATGKAVNDTSETDTLVSATPATEIAVNNTIVTGTPIVDAAEPDKVAKKAKGLPLDIFAKLLVTVSAAVGVIYSFSKTITTPLFMTNSGDARSFMRRSSDPMKQIRKHFSGLVDNINKKNNEQQLAIFIDDIDRCNKGYIVQLLEGIQTLFKEKRVLYIVAGDKQWITTSFTNTYKEFSAVANDTQELGELFLEKAFQLSIRMPNVTEEAKKNYWDDILGVKKEKAMFNSVEELDEDQQAELKEQLKTVADISDPDFMLEMQRKYNLSDDSVSNTVIDEKNKDTGEFRHLLRKFHSLIDSNPRAAKRLANKYSMTRSTLIAERRKFDPEKLLRWLLLEDTCPSIIKLATIESSLDSLIKAIDDGTDDKKPIARCELLLRDKEEANGGPMTMEEIKNFVGI